jgi:5-formyltetrahydrofolate cyclo-ligase
VPDVEAMKRALRAQVAARLPPAGSDEHRGASERAQQQLGGSAPAKSARCIALYRALKSEVSTADLAARLLAEGKDVCFPAVEEGDPVLHFRRPHGALRRGRHGIEEHEDVESARVRLSEIDLFVVPARAVDARGHRLGRGGGYYDATLAAASPHARRVCLVFDQQIVDRVPVLPHDVRMDFVCSDRRFIECPERD